MTAAVSTERALRGWATRGLSLQERLDFYSIPEPNSGCTLWLGQFDGKGYGTLSFFGRARKAHIYAYLAAGGVIPDGLVLDHLCRNTACVNPVHLEPVTDKVNILRGISLQAQNAKKTECPEGHSYDAENTRFDKHGARYCRACNRRLSRIRKQRAKERAA